jgi:hypothetical protein
MRLMDFDENGFTTGHENAPETVTRAANSRAGRPRHECWRSFQQDAGAERARATRPRDSRWGHRRYLSVDGRAGIREIPWAEARSG